MLFIKIVIRIYYIATFTAVEKKRSHLFMYVSTYFTENETFFIKNSISRNSDTFVAYLRNCIPYLKSENTDFVSYSIKLKVRYLKMDLKFY